jgi:hypothetical protein
MNLKKLVFRDVLVNYDDENGAPTRAMVGLPV